MINRRAFIKASLIGAASLGLAACGASNTQTEAETTAATTAAESAAAATSANAGAPSVLVAYYSAQGHTEAVAQTLIDELDADAFVIEPAEPYTSDDLNYNDDNSRVCQEHNDPNRNVELAQVTPDGWDNYDVVLVGYPIWWGDAAWVVDNFVKGNDFAGKTVIPFCTSASSGLGESGTLLAEMAGTGDWQEGMRFSSSVEASEVEEWVASLQLN